MPIPTNLGKESEYTVKSSGNCVSNTKRGRRETSTLPLLSCNNGRINWRVNVPASCLASDTSKSWRTSLWICPSALVAVLPSAWLVSVPPKIAFEDVLSAQSIIA